jgi:hypothetical protein
MRSLMRPAAGSANLRQDPKGPHRREIPRPAKERPIQREQGPPAGAHRVRSGVMQQERVVQRDGLWQNVGSVPPSMGHERDGSAFPDHRRQHGDRGDPPKTPASWPIAGARSAVRRAPARRCKAGASRRPDHPSSARVRTSRPQTSWGSRTRAGIDCGIQCSRTYRESTPTLLGAAGGRPAPATRRGFDSWRSRTRLLSVRPRWRAR